MVGRADQTVEVWVAGAPASVSNPVPTAAAGGGAASDVNVTDRAGRLVGIVTLDAATLAALETIQVGSLPAIALDAATLAALETIQVGSLPAVALDAATLAALESITAVGPVTDAQLRATPVPVSGTVATGGLTDTQLRATGVPVTEATLDALVKTEDSASASGDRGVPVLAVRNDAGASLVDTDGDYGILQIDSSGRLRVSLASSYLEDAAVTDGDRGVFVLVQRHDADTTTVSADGDYSALHVDANGRLKVVTAASYLEDAASTDGDRGLFVLAMRHDAETATVGTDGDYAALQVGAGGRLKVDGARPATSAQSTVANSASSVTVLAANAARKGATIFNDDTASTGATLKIKLGATASASSFTYAIAPQGYYEVPFGYTGIIDGIASAATGNARVTELT